MFNKIKPNNHSELPIISFTRLSQPKSFLRTDFRFFHPTSITNEIIIILIPLDMTSLDLKCVLHTHISIKSKAYRRYTAMVNKDKTLMVKHYIASVFCFFLSKFQNFFLISY